MTESTWKILKFNWKTPGKLLEFFFQKSGNPEKNVEISIINSGSVALYNPFGNSCITFI